MRRRDAVTMDRVTAVLSPDLLSPYWRLRADGALNPTLGHCYVAAEALYHLLGGKAAGLCPMVGRDEAGDTHWWLRTSDGTILDPTAEQYTADGLTPPYASGRGAGFLTARPSARAREVIRRVQRS